MKILFYDTKSYDKESFEATLKKFPGIQIDYIRSDLDPRTAALADGFDAVCAFVSSNVSEATLKILHEKGVRLVLLRCAGYNNVDLEKAAAYDICVMRVPGYSPEAVAEHGVLQAFPIANHCITMDEPFKIIYGVEGYFVNDLKKLVTNDKGQTLLDDYVVFDLETTGFSPIHDAIIEIGAVKVSNLW